MHSLQNSSEQYKITRFHVLRTRRHELNQRDAAHPQISPNRKRWYILIFITVSVRCGLHWQQLWRLAVIAVGGVGRVTGRSGTWPTVGDRTLRTVEHVTRVYLRQRLVTLCDHNLRKILMLKKTYKIYIWTISIKMKYLKCKGLAK